MVVAEVVGVGIFLSPANMVRTLGTPTLILAVWTVMGALTLAGALCYAELATRYPKAGGGYVFLREAYGPRCAFVYGWMMLLVVDPGLTAALGIGFAQYLSIALGLPSAMLPVLAVAGILGFGVLTLLGLDVSERVLTWTAAAKLAMVALLVIAGFATAAGTSAAASASTQTSAAAAGGVPLGALASAVMAAFFAFGGWWDLGKMSEEVASPRRTLPRALVLGVTLVTVLYALVSLTFVRVAPAPARLDAATDDVLVSAVGAALFGEAAGRLLAVMVVVAVSGSLAAVLLGSPRVYLGMARDGLFPARLARVDARRQVLRGSTILQVTLASVLALLGTFDQILGYFVPAAVFFLGLSAAAVLVLPRPPRQADVFRAPGHPLPILIFLTLIVAVLTLFVLGRPMETLLGAIIILLGVPVSWLVRPRQTRALDRSAEA